MTRYATLSIAEAEAIKARLWNGEMTTSLAVEYGYSQGTISNIKTGRQYGEARWPDHTMGGMPEYRRVQLMKAKSRDTTVQARLGGNNVPIEPELVKSAYEIFGCSPEEAYERGKVIVQQRIMEKKLAELDKLEKAIKARRKNNPKPAKPSTSAHIDTGASDPAKQPKMSWDEVKYKAGQLPIVIIADSGDDQDLRDAIATALTISPPSIWHDDKIFLRTVNDIKQRFINYREKLSTGN